MANIRSVTHALKTRPPGRGGIPQTKSAVAPRPEISAKRSGGKTSSKTITNATTKTITRAVGTSGNRPSTGSGGRGKSVNKAPNRVGVTRSFIGTKRMRKLTKDNIRAVTKGDIRRLARRGGVKRISGTIYDDIRNSMKSFLEMASP
ncbi:putative histone h4 protein [Golovinomyces cichoracearum]|uniref:Putative histone h4 protein n=1 Tax=Golovinomyces cichoracearum TaxID=62708 RepID=A0A420J4T4_9PEZI|nr:putative histone h4 protein [Golovinomyces cichoracearum]